MRRTVDKFSLLSVGNVTHTGDPRFKVTFQYPNNWRLHINPMLKDDAGLYMCQVSTHPPRVFTTNVTVMREYKLFHVLLLAKPRSVYGVCVCVRSLHAHCTMYTYLCESHNLLLHRTLCNYNIYTCVGKNQVMSRHCNMNINNIVISGSCFDVS